MLGAMLMTQHNLHYYHQLMAQLRGSIETGTFRNLATSYKTNGIVTMNLFETTAQAAEAAGPGPDAGLINLIMLGGFVIIFIFC